MLNTRIIARLDIKGKNVVKGIHFEGLRVMGNPMELAKKYSNAHELLYIDTVASLYGRNQLTELLRRTSDEIFIPTTVGGGIKSVQDATRLFNAGADKITINTFALCQPSIINILSSRFGVQAISVSIQAKRVNGGWICYGDNGREPTSRGMAEYCQEVVALGAGEILLTSIDKDGTMSGPDLDLIRSIKVDVPLVYSGGIATVQHAIDALDAGADAICIGSALHYNKLKIEEIEDGINQIKFPHQERCVA
jgi:cyclase